MEKIFIEGISYASTGENKKIVPEALLKTKQL